MIDAPKCPVPSERRPDDAAQALERIPVESLSDPTREILPSLEALHLVSVSHRTAPLEILETVALSPDQVRDLLGRLKAAGIEAVVLATCNRTELYWLAHAAADPRVVAQAMTQVVKHAPADFHRYSLDLEGYDAAHHLFRVAAGLESLMLGESEILGQMRTALELADRESAAGPLLGALLRSAMRFGREVRVSTRIGSGALSVASASVQTLLHMCPELSGMKVLVVGAGHTGYKVAQHLIAERVGQVVLINRTTERARRAAEELGATHAPIEELEAHMATADAVFVAVQTPAPIVTAEMVARAVAGRPVPLPILDLSLPRAVAAEVGDVPGAASFDLSRFEEVVAASRARREHEISRVEALLDSALERLEREAAEEAARPLVAELRIRAEAIRRAEVERAVAAGQGDAEVLDRVTRRVVDALLRVPSAALRRGPQTRARNGTCLQCVFGVRENAHDGD